MTKRTRNAQPLPGEVNQTYRNTAAVHQCSGKDEKGDCQQGKVIQSISQSLRNSDCRDIPGNINSIEATVAIAIENEMGTPIKTSTKNSQTV